jgi:Subtilisin inhibitor-like
MRSLLPLCALAMLLGACGGDDAADAGPPEPDTRLNITYRADKGAEPQLTILECGPAGGDHGDPEDACRRLAALDAPWEATPPNAACTEIYGGPQTATVTGRQGGKAVDVSFSRENGCEIARWDKHAFLFPGGE